tara:strand:- start:318 stop:449 length:132 start_codon:yes stop_codon:yes gene_type:complete
MDYIFYLWLPIILLALASLAKIFNKNDKTRKSWIRVEEIDENE